METSEKVTLVEQMASESDEQLITAFLANAEWVILNRLYSNGVPEGAVLPARYDYLQCRIATYMIDKIGAEGQLVHNENGIYRSYEAGDLPASLLNEIVPKVGVPGSA